MFSELAKNDLEALRKSGYNPTDEEVIKLNDLANKIERGKYTTPANHPRMGFAGNVVLHEPTIGGIEWFICYGKDSAYTDEDRFLTYLYMCSKCRNLDDLYNLTDAKQIGKEIKKWKKSLDCTIGEMWRALLWVKYGEEEFSPSQDKDDISEDELMNNLWMTVIAASGAMGLSPDDLKTHTQSEVIGMLIQANIRARLPMKNSVAKDYVAYRQLLKEIEERHGGKDDE